MALTYSKEKMVGAKAPDFTLPGVDEKSHSLRALLKGKQAAVIMFVCNHCPYVQAYWGRLIEIAQA